MSIDSFETVSSSLPDSSRPVVAGATPSVTPIQQSRLMPRLSFRVLLGVVTGSAGLAMVARLAFLGSPFALSIGFALGCLALTFAIFAVLFLIAWVPAVIGQDPYEDVHKGNPFSADQLPPQVLPPRDPGT